MHPEIRKLVQADGTSLRDCQGSNQRDTDNLLGVIDLDYGTLISRFF